MDCIWTVYGLYMMYMDCIWTENDVYGLFTKPRLGSLASDYTVYMDCISYESYDISFDTNCAMS